jgi:hypothetical protein
MLNFKTTLFAIGFIALFSCSKPIEKANPDRIKNIVTTLAADDMEGRGTATEGELKASDFIVQEFTKAGLEGFQGNFLHPYNFNMKVELGEENSLSINSKTLEFGKDFMPLSFSASAKLAETQLVFVGYGVEAKEYNDYSRKNVSNKIVVIKDGYPERFDNHSDVAMKSTRRNKVRLASEKGAVAVFFIADEISSTLQNTYVTTSVDIPVLTVSAAILNPIALQRRISVASIQTSINRPDLVSNNIVGIKKGRNTQKYIVLGAHYDHLGLGYQSGGFNNNVGQIHNGADDNASGTSGLIELAYKFKDVDTEYSIVFMAFSGEELGLLGARELVKQNKIENTDIIAMINMDMIGRLNNENEVTIYGTETGSTFVAALDSVNNAHQLTLKKIAYTPGNSDHFAFYQDSVPVLFFNTGLHGDYHRPSDDADLINSNGIASIVNFIGDLIPRISAGEVPVFTEVEEPNQRKVAPFKVYIGTNPDYAFQGKGLLLTGTSAGSPAEEAGFLKGDIVKSIDGRDINNIYDYMSVLGYLEAGKPVEAKVLRNKKEVSLKLTPAQKRK